MLFIVSLFQGEAKLTGLEVNATQVHRWSTHVQRGTTSRVIFWPHHASLYLDLFTEIHVFLTHHLLGIKWSGPALPQGHTIILCLYFVVKVETAEHGACALKAFFSISTLNTLPCLTNTTGTCWIKCMVLLLFHSVLLYSCSKALSTLSFLLMMSKRWFFFFISTTVFCPAKKKKKRFWLVIKECVDTCVTRMFMYVYVIIFIYAHTHINLFIYAYIHFYIHNVYVYMYLHIHWYIDVYTCMYNIYMYMHLYMCVFVCIYNNSLLMLWKLLRYILL